MGETWEVRHFSSKILLQFCLTALEDARNRICVIIGLEHCGINALVVQGRKNSLSMTIARFIVDLRSCGFPSLI